MKLTLHLRYDFRGGPLRRPIANITHSFSFLLFPFPKTWRNRPDSITGFYVRKHTYNPKNNTGTYTHLIRNSEYSMVLTKIMFMSSDYLFAYTCLLPQSVHHYVDEQMNCEDIAINML